jgi:diketogulonate reductase-like aldo/keto reductase
MLVASWVALIAATPWEFSSITLRNNVSMPLVFTGTWRYNDTVVAEMLSTYLAKDVGGVAVDTALVYQNQKGVGNALSKLPRESFFLQTKVPGCERTNVSILSPYLICML